VGTGHAQDALARAVRRVATAGRNTALQHGHHRRHLALLSVVLLVSVFGYVLIEPRTVRVHADGQEVVVQTRTSSDEAVLRMAGVGIGPGDRVTALNGPASRVLQVERARPVTLQADGFTYHMLTHAETIDQLLAEADVAFHDRDSVLHNGSLVSVNSPVDPPNLFASLSPFPSTLDRNIEVRRAVPFTIVEDGREKLTTSSRPTVAMALREAGVQLGPGDAVTPDIGAELEADMRIEVRHASAVTIALPSGHDVLYTLAETVAAALDEAGVVLPSGAYVDPPLDTPVTDGMRVRVVQLSASSDVEYEYIESDTVYRGDPSLAPGETRTVAGHDGVYVRRYSITYVNGEEVGRELAEEYFDPEPADTVVYYSTQSRTQAPPPPAEVASGRVLRVYATWYNPASAGRAPTDPLYGVTATGVQVTYGIVAVDPNVIPLGTRMYIPGYGYGVAADTGGAVKGYIIDLGFPDGVEVDWRTGWVDIYILD
jgi:resuscitation-promoting factor RpfB